MTDGEIIKALECCERKNCNTCPCFDEDIECGELLIGHTINLINRQKSEIERLKQKPLYDFYKEKSEAINEFAERLKEKAESGFWQERKYVETDDIDNLVKEMTEQSVNYESSKTESK